MSLDVFISALLIGFLGAGHCIGMCGGISSALTFAIKQEEKFQRLKIVCAYNAGRILSYVIIGSIAASLAAALQNLGFPYFRVLAAILMILMGFYLSGFWKVLVWLERGGKFLWRYIQPFGNRLMPVKNVRDALLLGALWGWLPCGLVYTALAFSTAQANYLDGAIVMLAFGLGTLPAVITGSFAADLIRRMMQGRAFRYLSALVMILFGVWTLYGSLGHAHHAHHVEETSGAEHHHHHHH